MKILLVEDNPLDRMFVTRALCQVADFDFELIACESLSESLERIALSPFDIVLLDLSLPDCEGLETCRRIIAAVPRTPVVVMTATDDRRLATEALRVGAQDYLVKGAFPGSAIARVLQYAINRSRFQFELAHQDNRFREVMSHVPAIIWTTDRNLVVTSVMGSDLLNLKLDPREIVGQPLEALFQRVGDADGIIQAHQQAREGQPGSLQTEWLDRFFEFKVDPLHEAGGSVAGTIGVALDVTERRVLDREIEFARLVQQSLLPAEDPHLRGFDIFSGAYPAKRTCGDWFDYLEFTDHSLGLVVGDVSGKGFGPAILSATIAAYLEMLAASCSDVWEILSVCNHMVCKRHLEGQFAVLSLARLQPGGQSLTYCGAGEGMLIISANGQLKHRVLSSGLPLGMIDDFRYDPPAQIPLEPGYILLLLTDGFREASSRAGELFGVSRIVETVAANLSSSAGDILHSLRQAVRQFVDGHCQQDDMTGIVVKVLDE